MFNMFFSCFSRSDFVTLPFQGAEVLLDSVMPLSGNSRGLWLEGWGAVVESLIFPWRTACVTVDGCHAQSLTD